MRGKGHGKSKHRFARGFIKARKTTTSIQSFKLRRGHPLFLAFNVGIFTTVKSGHLIVEKARKLNAQHQRRSSVRNVLGKQKGHGRGFEIDADFFGSHRCSVFASLEGSRDITQFFRMQGNLPFQITDQLVLVHVEFDGNISFKGKGIKVGGHFKIVAVGGRE